MKTFRWDWAMKEGTDYYIPWLSERDGNIGKVWASLIAAPVKGFYFPVVVSKDRSKGVTLNDPLRLAEAKEACIKKLFDDGIMEDKDILEDYMGDE